MNNKLNKIFEIVSFFDNCRWSYDENYNLINFYKDDLDNDTKLLTHWLCYIADRQMDFKRIWDVGGFIFSELVHKYKQVSSKEEILILLDPESEKSFIREDKDEKNNKIKYSFIGSTKPNDLILKNYSNINPNEIVFKSRYLPSDYYNICYTLEMLFEYEKSLTCFIAQAYKANRTDKDHLIQKILFSLYLLTYYYDDNGQPAYENIKEQNIDIRNRTKKAKEILLDPDKFEKEFEVFKKTKMFQQKRAWCSLRDFMKSLEFSGYFKNSLKEYLSKNKIDELLNDRMLYQLELPGDVWNNNPKFQNCIFGDSFDDKGKKKFNEFNRFLREYYDNNEKLKAGTTYPEQFDITFDFVPRMCDKNNCNICPIGALSDKKTKFEMICIDDTTKYCPVALVGCGYKKECYGQAICKLRKAVLNNEQP